jgi:multidrug efflux pump subunit AcrA (membrane-fusion protein)
MNEPSNRFFCALKLALRQLLTARNRQYMFLLSGVLLAGTIAVIVWWPWKANAVARDGLSETSTNEPVRAFVEVIEVNRVDSVRLPREFSGSLRAARSSELGFKRTGRIVKVYVEQGEVVDTNQILAELDTDTLQASRAELQAQRLGAIAFLEELVSGPRQQTIAAARAEVADFESQRQLAKIDFDRKERLRDAKAISEQEFDDAQSNLLSVNERLNAAKMRLAELEEGTRKEKIKSQQAEVSRLEAMIQRIEVDLQESKLLAPYPGRISQRLFDEGSIVNPGQSVFRVVEHGELEAWIGVPPEIAAKLSFDQRYSLQVDKLPLQGQLKAILPELDPTTRTITVRFKVLPVDNSLSSDSQSVCPPECELPSSFSSSLVPGRMIRVQLEQELQQSGIWVPMKALARGQRGLWSVFVANRMPGNTPSFEPTFKLERRDVEVLIIDVERVLIRGEIQTGDLLVTTGLHRFTPGQMVQISDNR